MRTAAAILTFALAAGHSALAAERHEATIFKEPNCLCCSQYADYLRENGFEVTLQETDNLAGIKKLAGVPERLAACHTVSVGGYTVEGHVPVDVVERLLEEKPPLRGIALPGMPAGSPGMGGEKAAPFVIYEIAAGGPKVYATR